MNNLQAIGLERSSSTVSVYTRHSADCSRSDDPNWKRCRCRKWLYIYRRGRAERVSAKTRSWEEAERQAQTIRNSWDPVLRAIDEQKKRELATSLDAITVEAAVDQWLKGKKFRSAGTSGVYQTAARKIRDWSAEQGFEYLSEVTEQALDKWRGQWSPDAHRKDDRMGPTTQRAFLVHLQNFFAWARKVRLLDSNPADALEPIEAEGKKTLPLSKAQFAELLKATERFDEAQRRQCDRYGQELRVLFLLMRWSGLRVGDAAALPRKALVGNRITTRILKSKRQAKTITVIVPDAVVKALNDLPDREGVHPDYFFWSRRCSTYSLSTLMSRRIDRLRAHLDFVDDHGQALDFHSHMLRDTFAVEMLMAGVALEDVSKMLAHSSVKVTERYYSPWIKARQEQLEEKMAAAMRQMGVTVGTAE